MKTNIPQLTFTRFIASISIVLFHFAATSFPFDKPFLHYFISHANLGVSYFFVLLGFILTVVYDSKFFAKDGAYKKFLGARLARIYPVYFIALLLSVAAVFIYNKDNFSLASAVSNALLIQSWIPEHIRTYNTPGWSLSAEAFFYLVFPWLVYKIYRDSITRSTIIAIAVWLLSFAGYLYFVYHIRPGEFGSYFFITHSNPLMQVNNFLIGIAGGIAYKQDRLSLIKRHSLSFLLGSIVIIMIVFFIPNPIIENALDGLIAPLFLLFILSLSYHQGIISKTFSNKYLVYLGDISYSIYILQAPLSFWFRRIGKMAVSSATTATPVQENVSIAHHSSSSQTLHQYMYIVFLILFSALTYSYFEKPVRNYFRSRC